MLEVREEGEEVLFSLFLLAICPRKLMKGTVHINSQRGRHSQREDWHTVRTASIRTAGH